MASSSLKCSQLGKFVLSSGLLQSSWSKISEIHESTCPNLDPGLGIKIYQEDNHTYVLFDAPPIPSNVYLNSDSTFLSGSLDQNPFHFLRSEKISSFSLHAPAFKLFVSAYQKNLTHLKSKLLDLLKCKKSVIITGAALGGSVASLFTLWLLEKVEPGQKRPLCITFGSPLIGDASLQQILENSVRNSCFLHVIDAQHSPITAYIFKPFGMFLICIDSGLICIEDPQAIMELLTSRANTDQPGWRNYGEVLNRLDQSEYDSRLIIDEVMIKMDERAAKNVRFDPVKKLDNIKISMVYLEWYKKKSRLNKIGYYDRFKNHIKSPVSKVDMNIEKRKRELQDYWKSLVEEVEKKPQSEISILKSRSLFAGNNYRRLVEPLDIAEYYLSGQINYRTSGRSRHYHMLEKWFKAKIIEPVRCKKRDLTDLLTFDSCFWAEVEEALIVNSQLKTDAAMTGDKREELIRKLVRFVEYVWGMIGKREVSPEIFLEKSSFMRWWKEYKEIKRVSSSPSNFIEFMNTGKYESYGRIIRE